MTALGPSCYKVENAEASKDVFSQQKLKRQFKFQGEGQHNMLKERNYEQVSEQEELTLFCVFSLPESFVIVHL